jgi:hypothetical protein
MFSNLVNQASKFAMEGVKNLVVKQYVNQNFQSYFDDYLSFSEITRNKNR